MSGNHYHMHPSGHSLPYPVNDDSFPQSYDGNSEASSSIDSQYGREDLELPNSGFAYNPSPNHIYQYPVNAHYGIPGGGGGPVDFGVEDMQGNSYEPNSNVTDTNASSSSHLQRKRAQNRASQRAFRARKEKHVREIEERLQRLQGEYENLSQSYDSLRKEYALLIAKELERLAKAEGMKEETSQCSTISEPSPGASSSAHDMRKDSNDMRFADPFPGYGHGQQASKDDQTGYKIERYERAFAELDSLMQSERN